MSNLTYFQDYPEQLLPQVRTLINEQRLGDVLVERYLGTHDYTTDKALWQYTQDPKNQFLRDAPPINKVTCDNRIHVLKDALRSRTAVSRMQGDKLRARAEIRVATVFRNVLELFLCMIVVHELMHLKEKGHNRVFYQLCRHTEPQYHQLESDTRLRLTQLPLGQDKIQK